MHEIPKFFINFAPNKKSYDAASRIDAHKILYTTYILTHNTTQYSIYYYD